MGWYNEAIDGGAGWRRVVKHDRVPGTRVFVPGRIKFPRIRERCASESSAREIAAAEMSISHAACVAHDSLGEEGCISPAETVKGRFGETAEVREDNCDGGVAEA